MEQQFKTAVSIRISEWTFLEKTTLNDELVENSTFPAQTPGNVNFLSLGKWAPKRSKNTQKWATLFQPKIRMYSKYERRTDTRTYEDRRKLYEGVSRIWFSCAVHGFLLFSHGRSWNETCFCFWRYFPVFFAAKDCNSIQVWEAFGRRGLLGKLEFLWCGKFLKLSRTLNRVQ